MQSSHGSYGYDVMTVKDIVNSKYAVFFVVSKVHSLCMQGDKNYLNLICFLLIQVVPGRAGGGSFKRKNNYIAKKEFAYRMCAR